MTLTIEISDELEAVLQAKAREQGLTTDRLVHDVLAQALAPALEVGGERPSALTRTDGEQKARAFVQWAKGHRETPLLSDEAVSRAGMYPDRW
ncbi:MAG: hypothetical protein JNN08_18360 [Bryobacterales bacterium]|nr:hypothetical protein [Bryobacterales bacterium]